MFVTVKEAREHCNLSVKRIRKACQCGEIAALKNPHENKWYMNLCSLQDYVERIPGGRWRD